MNKERKPVFPAKGSVPLFGDRDLDNLARFHYLPLFRTAFRARGALALRALNGMRFGRFLEVGYGPGFLLPSLARISDELFSFDIHPYGAAVRQMLDEYGARPSLWRGSVLEIAAADDSFDGILCMSVMEHFEELDRLALEMKRVLKPGGKIVLGIPSKSVFSEALFRLAGYRGNDMHPSSHGSIMSCAERHFRLEAAFRYPGIPGLPVLYRVCRYSKSQS